MAPPFTARMADAIKIGSPIALLAKIELPAQDYYFWTGIGPLAYDGQSWIGLGRLGRIQPITYSSDLAIQEVNFSLVGMSLDDETFLTEDIRNRPATVWLAAIGTGNRVVAAPKQILKAVLDYPKYSVSDDGVATITLVARSGFVNLERAIDRVYSAERQRAAYPGDSGCDLIPSLQDQDVIWSPT